MTGPTIDLDTTAVAVPEAGDYEPPRIECIVSAEDLAREVRYAGFPSER